jgi:hypothetical protein
MPLNVYDHNASYTDVTTAFLAESRRNLIASHTRIEHCLNQLTDDQLWSRPNPDMNAIANLLLHLSGNVGQWITSAIENTPPTRNRPAEFSEKGPIPKQALRDQLQQTITRALAAIDSIKTPDQLLAPRHVQGNDTTILTAIYHSVSHFEGHTQEIISMTRQLKGNQYAFLWTPKTPQQASNHSVAP